MSKGTKQGDMETDNIPPDGKGITWQRCGGSKDVKGENLPDDGRCRMPSLEADACSV